MDLIVVAWTVIFLSLIVLWIKRRRERLSIFKQNNIPGPEPSFWTGNLNEYLEKREKYIEDMVKKYGKQCGFFLGMKPYLIVTDQELIKSIQVKEFGKFPDRDFILDDSGMPQPEVVKAVPASFGEEWRKNRTLLSPLFSTKKLRRMMPIIKEACDTFMEKLKKASSEECVNIIKILRNCNMDIMTKVTLGIDTGVQHVEDSKILSSAKLFLSADIGDTLAKISLCFPEIEPIPTKLRNIKDSLKYDLGIPSVKCVLNSVREVMTNRRRTSQRREDMLQGLMEEKAEIKRLMRIKDEELTASLENRDAQESAENKHETSNTSKHHSLSDDIIVGTSALLLVAGIDTTSMTICRATCHLSKNEDIQERVREELRNALGDKENIDYDDLAKLSYMEQVISETLRLYSTGPLTINRITRETYHYNGITIPEGVTVIIPSSILHKNPEHWTDPAKFDPDRFSPENKANVNFSVYQPFGNGPRNCVGMRFAQVVIRYMLAQLIRSFRVKSCGKDILVNRAMFIDQVEEFLVKLEAV